MSDEVQVEMVGGVFREIICILLVAVTAECVASYYCKG